MKTVMHFGAGALGRGLTIPMLVNSGCRVIVVDSYQPVVDALKEKLSYDLYSVDAEADKQHTAIEIHGVLSVKEDLDEVKDLLKNIDIVTTSVIQENLIHVARILAEVWNVSEANKKMVLLCENLENASDFFKRLLKECSSGEEQTNNLMKILIPDTMVDRSCSKNPENLLQVITSEFYEIAVDKKVVKDTGIKFIPAVDNIDLVFARKRFLVNTFADATAFLGLKYKLSNLNQAFNNKELQNELAPFMDLVKKSLVAGYGMSVEEVEKWEQIYKDRFIKRGNTPVREDIAENVRPLENVARNMFRKLSYEERFVKPLVILRKHNVDISAGVKFVAELVQAESKKKNMPKEAVEKLLSEMWCIDNVGLYIYDEVMKILDT